MSIDEGISEIANGSPPFVPSLPPPTLPRARAIDCSSTKEMMKSEAPGKPACTCEVSMIAVVNNNPSPRACAELASM